MFGWLKFLKRPSASDVQKTAEHWGAALFKKPDPIPLPPQEENPLKGTGPRYYTTGLLGVQDISRMPREHSAPSDTKPRKKSPASGGGGASGDLSNPLHPLSPVYIGAVSDDGGTSSSSCEISCDPRLDHPRPRFSL